MRKSSGAGQTATTAINSLANTLVEQVQQQQTQQATSHPTWFQSAPFKYINIGWRFVVGAFFLFYLKYFKSPTSFKKGHQETKIEPEYKLWFINSILISSLSPIIDFFRESKKQQETEMDVIALIALGIQILYFASNYFYIKNSMSTLGPHFKLIFWNDKGVFSWERVKFFGSRIWLILIAELAVSIAFAHLLQAIFPTSKAANTENQKRITDSLKDTRIIMIIISVLIFAPVFEELIYRRSILKTANFHTSTLFSSALIFGLIHLNSSKETIFHLLPYFCGGLVFAWSYKKYRNIWISIFVHFLHNLTALFSAIAHSTIASTIPLISPP